MSTLINFSPVERFPIANSIGPRRKSDNDRVPAANAFRLPVSPVTSAGIAIAAIAIGYFGLVSQMAAAEPGDGNATADLAVTVTRTKRMCFVDTLQVAGVLVAKDEILVRPDREGLQITQILVEPGDTVTSGQTLVRLTPPEGAPGGGSSTSIQAPAAGVVTSVSAVVGTTASARAEPLVRIAKNGEMELVGETPINTLVRLALKQSATLEILGIGKLAGKVRLFSTAIDPTTQLGQVRVLVDTDQRLRVGAFGQATIDVGERCGAAIPLSAVLYEQGGAIVQVVRANRIETRGVTVGLLAAGQAEIREGLSEGDMVVARAGAFVRDGDRVRSMPAAESSDRK
jgi:HlyD family secretion protein